MNQRIKIVLYLLALMGLAFGDTPQIFPRETVRAVVVAVINGEFEQADSIATVLVEHYPRQPWGYFYKGAIIQSRMIDRNAVVNDPKFWFYMKRTIEVVNQLSHPDPMALFFKGSAYYYMAFHSMKLHQWWQAYRYTRRGVHVLETAVGQDSTLWDAYLGIGAYKFWKSQKAGVLRFLFLIKNEKELGLELVQKAVKHATLVPELARDQLVYMLMDDGQFQRAWHLARANVQQFPHSRFFLWTFAKASFAARQWVAADSAYKKIWRYVKEHPEQQRNFAHVLARLARCACELGRVEESRDYMEQLQQWVNIKEPPDGIQPEEWQALFHLPCIVGHVSR